MKRFTISKIGCFTSSMLMFNALHLLNMGNNQAFYAWFWKCNAFCLNNTKAIIIGLEILFGILFTVRILAKNDDKLKNKQTGKKLNIIDIKDDTESTYLGKYSLLILTSLSLPTTNNIYSFLIYFIVQITLGVIFIYKNLIYINPILTILQYNIYRCNCEEKGSVYDKNKSKNHIILSKSKLTVGSEVTIRNTNNTLLKLGKTYESRN